MDKKLVTLAILALLVFASVMTVAAVLPTFAPAFPKTYSLDGASDDGVAPCGDPVEGGGIPT